MQVQAVRVVVNHSPSSFLANSANLAMAFICLINLALANSHATSVYVRVSVSPSAYLLGMWGCVRACVRVCLREYVRICALVCMFAFARVRSMCGVYKCACVFYLCVCACMYVCMRACAGVSMLTSVRLSGISDWETDDARIAKFHT